MRLDKRIIQAIEEYQAKTIELKKKSYDELDQRTKKIIELNGVKIKFNNKIRSFKAIF